MQLWPFVFLLCMVGALKGQKQYSMIIDLSDDGPTVAYECVTKVEGRHSRTQQTLSRDSFVLWMVAELQQRPETKRDVLCYIHGMWGSQKSNFRRAYHLLSAHYLDAEASDIGFMLAIKWPGNDMDYQANKQRVYKLSGFLAEEMTAVLRRMQLYGWLILKQQITMDLMAHSLGNELIKEMMLDLDDEQLAYPFFDQALWLAADLDHTIFEDTGFSSRLPAYANRHHFYYSERDLTLEISNKLNRLDRLGRIGPAEDIIIPRGVYFVDVSHVRDEKFLPDLLTGHSYYRSSGSVAGDILNVLKGGESVEFPGRVVHPRKAHVYIYDPSLN